MKKLLSRHNKMEWISMTLLMTSSRNFQLIKHKVATTTAQLWEKFENMFETDSVIEEKQKKVTLLPLCRRRTI